MAVVVVEVGRVVEIIVVVKEGKECATFSSRYIISTDTKKAKKTKTKKQKKKRKQKKNEKQTSILVFSMCQEK